MSLLRILVLHGPNLNLLGSREPDHYGSMSLADINCALIELGNQLSAEIITFQSNHEGELVDKIQQASLAHSELGHIDGIIMNPAAYTHTSIALRDAILAGNKPFIEVHLSNIHQREHFRHRSMLADTAVGVIAGFGACSYELALRGMIHHLKNTGG